MKKTLSILSLLILWTTPLLGNAQYANDIEFTTALERMHTQWLTKYDTVEAFRPWDQLTRQEAAKFFSSVLAFSTIPAWENQSDFDCDFEDSTLFDMTLSDSIQLACTAGLMRGYDNKFHPNDILTKAEALTILIRMQSWVLDETSTPRRSNYYATAFNSWLTKESDTSKIELPVTRYEAALLLNRQYWAPILPWSSTDAKDVFSYVQEQEVKDTLRSNYLRTE